MPLLSPPSQLYLSLQVLRLVIGLGNPIQAFLLNACSLVNKLSLQFFAYSSSFSIFCFTETWLNDSIYYKELLPSDLTTRFKHRLSRGGGAMIAIKNFIPSNACFSLRY